MAVLAAAALLDELMGRNRNIAPNEKAKELNWEDPEVSFPTTCIFRSHVKLNTFALYYDFYCFSTANISW